MKKLTALLLSTLILAGPAFADSTINGLTAGAAVSGTDILPAYQGANPATGVTAAQIKAYTNTSAVDARITTSEAIATSDQGKLVTFTNASAVAATIGQATSGTFFSGWATSLKNLGAGTVTLTPTTSTIDGNATLTLTTGQGVDLYSDGTNYFTQPGKGGGSGTVTTTGSPASGNLAKFSGSTSITNGDLSGDCTTSGTLAATCRETAPVYIATHWYEAGDEHAGGGTLATNASANSNKIFCYPEYFHGPATIGALGLRIGTASAGGNYQVAIYANNAATFRPTGTALLSSASLSTTSTGSVSTSTLTGSGAITGTPLLWWCTNSDNGTAAPSGLSNSFMAAVGGTTTQSALNTGSANRLFGVSVNPATFGTWPDLTSATFSELTGTTLGTVQFQISSVP